MALDCLGYDCVYFILLCFFNSCSFFIVNQETFFFRFIGTRMSINTAAENKARKLKTALKQRGSSQKQQKETTRIYHPKALSLIQLPLVVPSHPLMHHLHLMKTCFVLMKDGVCYR